MHKQQNWYTCIIYLTDSDPIKKWFYQPNIDTDTRISAAPAIAICFAMHSCMHGSNIMQILLKEYIATYA